MTSSPFFFSHSKSTLYTYLLSIFFNRQEEAPGQSNAVNLRRRVDGVEHQARCESVERDPQQELWPVGDCGGRGRGQTTGGQIVRRHELF